MKEARTRVCVSCFGRPSIGTENEVIATNICIEEFEICKMSYLLLGIIFSFHKRAVGIPICVSS